MTAHQWVRPGSRLRCSTPSTSVSSSSEFMRGSPPPRRGLEIAKREISPAAPSGMAPRCSGLQTRWIGRLTGRSAQDGTSRAVPIASRSSRRRISRWWDQAIEFVGFEQVLAMTV